MLFNIQKKSFWKVCHFYRKKLLVSLIFPCIFIPFVWFGAYFGLTKTNFGGVQKNFQIFSAAFFGSEALVLFMFLFNGIQSLSGISQSFFELRGKQKNNEEVYLLLFACPFNRQTLVAAKMFVLAAYYFLISLIGLTLPILLMLGFKSNLSLGGIFGFLTLHLVFSLVNFLFVAPPLLYFLSNYSFQNQLIAIFYLMFFIFITLFLNTLSPLLAPLWFLVSLPIGGYFTYLYWKNVQNKDY